MTLTLSFSPEIKIYSLGGLYTLQCCIIALAVCYAATKTLILCKALRMNLHMHIIIPCQTSHRGNHLSGAFQFFSLLLFLFFMPIQLPLANQLLTI